MESSRIAYDKKPVHVKPEDENAVCWLLDVRRYGITVANRMHANDEIVCSDCGKPTGGRNCDC